MIDKLNINFLKSNYHKYKEIGTAISIGVIYRFLSVLINFYTGVLIARDLGEANRGLFGLFLTSLFFFNVFLNFGFNNSAAYFASKSPDKMKQYLSTNFILSIFSSIVIIISLFIFSLYFNFQSDSLRYLFLICYIFYSFSLIYRSFLVGQNHLIYSQKIDFYLRLGYLIYILILYINQAMSVFNILLYVTLEYLIFSILSKFKIKVNIFPLQFNFQFFKDTFLFNSKTYLAAILATFILRFDQYLIKYFYGNFQVGIYSICSTIIENMCIVTSMIAVFYIPKLFAEKNLTLILNKSRKILGFILISSIAMASVIYIISPWLIELYFKKTNPEAVTLLRVLLIGFVSWSIFIFIHTIYFSLRFKKSLLIIMTFCLAINIGINYFLIPKYGIITAAWSSSISYTILATLCYIDLFILKKNNFLKKENEH